jgi:hypothetical protein
MHQVLSKQIDDIHHSFRGISIAAISASMLAVHYDSGIRSDKVGEENVLDLLPPSNHRQISEIHPFIGLNQLKAYLFQD